MNKKRILREDCLEGEVALKPQPQEESGGKKEYQ